MTKSQKHGLERGDFEEEEEEEEEEVEEAG